MNTVRVTVLCITVLSALEALFATMTFTFTFM